MFNTITNKKGNKNLNIINLHVKYITPNINNFKLLS